MYAVVCRRGLYVIYIVTYMPSFRRSSDLDKSNKFRQMQDLTNDNDSDSRLYSIFHIEHKAIAFINSKTEPTITCLIRH